MGRDKMVEAQRGRLRIKGRNHLAQHAHFTEQIRRYELAQDFFPLNAWLRSRLLYIGGRQRGLKTNAGRASSN